MATTSNSVNSTANLVYTTNNTGSAGQFLTATGSNGTNWSQINIPNTHFNSSNNNPVMTIPYGEDKVIVEEKAELEVKGRMVLNGRDVEERLGTIEKVLRIPERDVKLEKKHPKLKKLYDEYINELEKYRTWDRIKGEE